MSTFLERYQAGDHVAVWEELTDLGAGVRQELYYADAAAVATETMRRVRRNTETLIRRLFDMGYQFLNWEAFDKHRDLATKRLFQMEGLVQGQYPQGDKRRFDRIAILKSKELLDIMEAEAARSHALALQDVAVICGARKPPLADPLVFDPPTRHTAEDLRRLETMAGGPLPLSLRAWYEQVGSVSLQGWHSKLRPNPDEPLGSASTDFLMIHPLKLVMEQWSGFRNDAEEMQLALAPDAVIKDGCGGCGPYYMSAPNQAADGIFDDDNGRTFVGYLRNSFEWGGFPGWADSKHPPMKEIAELKEGLLSF